MAYSPNFSFRTHGGECAGTQWIYDHDDPIALFEKCLIEQPEQNLRYFNVVPRPLNLRHLKLKPGGRPLFSGVQLYWKLPGNIFTTELLDLVVEGQGTNYLRMTFLTQYPDGIAVARRLVTITYDPEICSYVYDFECHLCIHSPETILTNEILRFEYSDPWYTDLPAPHVAFPGMWKKPKFTHIVCEREDGSIQKMPLHHVGLRQVSSTRARSGSMLVPVFEQGNNPAIQLVDESSNGDVISVCYWGYDVHLSTHVLGDELSRPISRRFRVFLCPDKQAEKMLEIADPVPTLEMQGMTELPLYERETSFEKACPLNQPTPGPTDPWSWLPSGEGLTYEKDFGRSDNYSLKIQNDTPELAMWYTDREGEGSFTEPWPEHIGFRVTGYIKTDSIIGRGSCLAIRWERYNQSQIYPYAYSTQLKDTNDWTKVSVELSGKHPHDCSAICIALMQDGPGTTWFDDLKVEVFSGSRRGKT